MAKQKINKSKNTALESHKKSDKAKWAITFISLILIATLLGGLSFYIVNNNKTNNPPAISNNNIYFDCLDYQLTESEMATEVSKFYNGKVLDNGDKSFNPSIKKIILNSIDTKKTLYTPCFKLFECSLEYESSSKIECLVSFNLSKLFEDNNLVMNIPNITDNYGDITWKIGKTNDTDTVEYGYAFRQLDNNDIILSIGFRGETATFVGFIMDSTTPIEIDINI